MIASFLLGRPIFFRFWTLQLAVFEQSFSKIVIFDFRLGFLRLIRASVPNFVNLGQKLRSSEKKWSFYTHPVLPWEQCINIWKQHISSLHIKFKIGKWLKFIGVIHILKMWTLKKHPSHIMKSIFFFQCRFRHICFRHNEIS